MERLIYHIDVNNAFLSWEALERLKENPSSTDIRTIPSAICGDPSKRHGIILAKSPIAKQYHVTTAETIQSAQKKCPNLQLFPARHSIYQEYSKRFHSLLQRYTDIKEPFSIDEAFLDMTKTYHLFGTTISTAYHIQKTILEKLGFTVNVGVSSNKVLAKMASDFEKPYKVHTLFPKELPDKLWPLPVERLLFAGHSTCQKLKTLGIYTIGDLAHTAPVYLQSHLGKNGLVLHNYANGIDPSPVQSQKDQAKGYSNSVTTDHDITDVKEAKQILLTLCETVAHRMRKDQINASVVSVQIKNCFFEKQSKQATLSESTNHTKLLYEQICTLFDALWDQRTPIRLLGVHATKLSSAAFTQMNLFDMNTNQNEKLEQALDTIRSKFGTTSIMRASCYHPHPKKKENKEDNFK